MIDHEKTEIGDIVRDTQKSTSGFCKVGDLLRILERTEDGFIVEDRNGKTIEMVYNGGDIGLEPTEWKKDFPESDIGVVKRLDYNCSDCGFHDDGQEKKCDPKCCINPEMIYRHGTRPACEKIRLKS